MSKILDRKYDDFDQPEHRIKLLQLSGLVWFIIDKIADDAALDGWGVVYSKVREYVDEEKEAIHKREAYIRDVLENLLIDPEREVQALIMEKHRRDGWGVIVPTVGASQTQDIIPTKRINKIGRLQDQEIPAKPRGELKRIQVYAPNSVRIDSKDINELGDPTAVHVKIRKKTGTSEKRFSLISKPPEAILFKGRQIDNESNWIGQSVLERNLAYIIMLEWTAFSGADFANNRGSFILLKYMLPNASEDKLKELQELFMKTFTRNAGVATQDIEAQQMAPGGMAVPIAAIETMLYDLLATGTAIPAQKLKGAAKGALSSAKEDRIDYYPVLRAEQVWLVPYWKQIIKIIDPTFFSDYNLTIEFKIEINMSESERAQLRMIRLRNIREHARLLQEHHYTIHEIQNIVEDPEILPVFETEGDERNNIIIAVQPKSPDMGIEVSGFPEEFPESPITAEPVGVTDALNLASGEQLAAALFGKSDRNFREMAAGMGTTVPKLAGIINYLKETIVGA